VEGDIQPAEIQFGCISKRALARVPSSKNIIESDEEDDDAFTLSSQQKQQLSAAKNPSSNLSGN